MQVTGAQAKCIFAYFTCKQLAEGPSNSIMLVNSIPGETFTPVLETHTHIHAQATPPTTFWLVETGISPDLTLFCSHHSVGLPPNHKTPVDRYLPLCPQPFVQPHVCAPYLAALACRWVCPFAQRCHAPASGLELFSFPQS